MPHAPIVTAPTWTVIFPPPNPIHVGPFSGKIVMVADIIADFGSASGGTPHDQPRLHLKPILKVW